MKIALPAKDLPQRLTHSFKSVPNEQDNYSFKSVPNECNEWG